MTAFDFKWSNINEKNEKFQEIILVIDFRTKLSFTLSTANDGVLFGIITVQGKFEAEHA